jgi:thioredoxin 1
MEIPEERGLEMAGKAAILTDAARREEQRPKQVRGFPKAGFFDRMSLSIPRRGPVATSFFQLQGRTNMSEHIHHVTDDSFDPEVLQSATPVLVDYWAEWCGPCKMIAPILDEVAREYSGKLKVAKLNIDDNQATPPKYGIRGIPTLMIFKNGSVEATKVGALSKSQLTAFIDSHI